MEDGFPRYWGRRGYFKGSGLQWALADPLHFRDLPGTGLEAYVRGKFGPRGTMGKVRQLLGRHRWALPSRPVQVLAVAMSQNHEDALSPVFHDWGQAKVLLDRSALVFRWKPGMKTAANLAMVLWRPKVWRILGQLPGLVPLALYYYWWLDDLVTRLEPSVLVIANNTGFSGKMAMTLARRRGLRTVFVPHALVVGGAIGEARGMDLALCGTLREASTLQQQGIAQGKIRVIGHLFCMAPQGTRKPRTPPAGDRILLCVNGLLTAETIRAEISARSKTPGAAIRLRPHPGQDREALARCIPAGAATLSTESLDADLAWATHVVTAYSTVAHRAKLWGLPVELVGPPVRGDPYGFLETPAPGDVEADARPLTEKVKDARAAIETTLSGARPLGGHS